MRLTEYEKLNALDGTENLSFEISQEAKTLKAKAMKLNFGDSGVSFDNPKHVEKIARFFKAANDNRIAIIVHLEPGRFYGPKEVEIFLNRIVSVAPDIPIQIAHLAGDGPGITSPQALTAFAAARGAKDPRTKNLYLDSAGLVYKDMKAEEAELMVKSHAADRAGACAVRVGQSAGIRRQRSIGHLHVVGCH
jgi:hypothetical protein